MTPLTTIIGLALTITLGALQAATITVNDLADIVADDGGCTLREAIIAVNTDVPSGSMPGECTGGSPDPTIDRIEFASGVTGVINLSSALPPVQDPAEIIGPGVDSLTIDAAAQTTSAATMRIIAPTTIERLRIANTRSTASGGAINASQPLTLRLVMIENNEGLEGGAVFTTDNLTVEDCEFVNNSASQFTGGAIRFAGAGNTLIIRRSLFQDNRTLATARAGGAIDVGGSDHITEISASTFVGNQTEGGNSEGGAIRIGGQSLFLTNSTFTDNAATRSGGAVSLRAINPIIANVTISGNTADSDNDGVGQAGGLWIPNNTPTIRNSVIAGNQDLGGQASDCEGTAFSDGYNLIGDGSGCSGFSDGVNGDQVGSTAAPITPTIAARIVEAMMVAAARPPFTPPSSL